VRLWTIQHYQAYKNLLQKGSLTADEAHCWCDEDSQAYAWMAKKMKHRGLVPPSEVQYPIWAWFQWEGKRKKRDMRESGYSKRGDTMVQLTIEIDDDAILLSDFDLFHYVLNGWYLPKDEKDQKAFEKAYMALGFKWHDLSNFHIESQQMKALRIKIEKSWSRIFDLEQDDNAYINGYNAKKSIQATFWALKREQVIQAEPFIAK